MLICNILSEIQFCRVDYKTSQQHDKDKYLSQLPLNIMTNYIYKTTQQFPYNR